MGESENHDTNKFLEILETFGLNQHVMVSTHRSSSSYIGSYYY